uniref:Uncharacterized protein n=1 Tax=Glossina austeni TaxID=7395 RepID=A0A1A9VTS3_GLOAU
MLSISWPNSDLLFVIKQHCYHGHSINFSEFASPSIGLEFKSYDNDNNSYNWTHLQFCLVFSKISLITYITACSVAFEVDDDDDDDNDDGNDNDNDNDVGCDTNPIVFM